MVKYSIRSLNRTFAALSDPTRRAMLARLARGPASISELGEPFRMSLPAVMKHVSVLAEARLVERRKQGRVQRCTLAAKPLSEAVRWIEYFHKFWEEQFDSLERYLNLTETSEEDTEKWKQPKAMRPRRSSALSASSRRRARKSSAPGRTRKR